MANELLGYKGKPLVRSGDQIYYGCMTDPYVVMMQVLDSQEENGLRMAKKVSLHLLKTDPKLNPLESIVKKGEQESLYQALEMANIWLTKALEQ